MKNKIDFPKPDISKPSRYPLWTARDGVQWRLEDMTDSHLLNCVRLMEKRADRFVRFHCAEYYDIDNDLWRIDNPWESVLKDFYEEIKRRKSENIWDEPDAKTLNLGGN